MIVESVLSLGAELDIDMIGIKKVPGGSVTDSFYVDGVAFKRTFSYAGFEQQPKRFVSCLPPPVVCMFVPYMLHTCSPCAWLFLIPTHPYLPMCVRWTVTLSAAAAAPAAAVLYHPLTGEPQDPAVEPGAGAEG